MRVVLFEFGRGETPFLIICSKELANLSLIPAGDNRLHCGWLVLCVERCGLEVFRGAVVLYNSGAGMRHKGLVLGASWVCFVFWGPCFVKERVPSPSRAREAPQRP